MIATDYFPCDYYALHMAVREVDTGGTVPPYPAGQQDETIHQNQELA